MPYLYPLIELDENEKAIPTRLATSSRFPAFNGSAYVIVGPASGAFPGGERVVRFEQGTVTLNHSRMRKRQSSL